MSAPDSSPSFSFVLFVCFVCFLFSSRAIVSLEQRLEIESISENAPNLQKAIALLRPNKPNPKLLTVSKSVYLGSGS